MKQNTDNSPPSILLPHSELETIQKETVKVDERAETGGVLLGRRLSNGVVYTLAATRPGPDATHRQTEFAPDVTYAQSILDDYRQEYDVLWVGTWHKHPGQMNEPSQGDVVQMKEFVEDPELLDEILILITTYQDGVVKVNPFYMGQSLECVRTELRVVENVEGYREALRTSDSNTSLAGTESDRKSEDSTSGSERGTLARDLTSRVSDFLGR